MYSRRITIDEVIPWGKTFHEYQQYFSLQDTDLNKTIACFGDGASSFNSELTQLGKKIISFDPIYNFSAFDLEKRFYETLEQFKLQINFEKPHVDTIVQEVISSRETATKMFLSDLEKGKEEKRYLTYLLPKEISFGNNFFDLGLISHFLLMYDDLGIDFHIQSITEILRVCKEVRIYPILNIYGQTSTVLNPFIDYLKEKNFDIKFISINYKFNSIGKLFLKINN